MRNADEFVREIEELRELMVRKLGVRAKSFPAALSRAGRRLPRAIRREGQVLAQAIPLSDHPKLARTLDTDRLGRAAVAMREYLDGIDLADRRWGVFLGILGSIAFNFLLAAALVIVWLAWRGKI